MNSIEKITLPKKIKNDIGNLKDKIGKIETPKNFKIDKLPSTLKARDGLMSMMNLRMGLDNKDTFSLLDINSIAKNDGKLLAISMKDNFFNLNGEVIRKMT